MGGTRLFTALAAWLIALVPASTIATPAVDLLPHRALYRMSLDSADRGSGIAGARGTMLYQFADRCDGWTVDSRVRLVIVYSGGEEVETRWSFVSWESKTGLRYRYRVRHDRDGETVERLTGRAVLDAGGGGAARFDEPEGMAMELGDGTLFPTQHLKAILAAARAGRPLLSRTLFDGASLDNPFEVNAVMSPIPTTGRKAIPVADGLGAVPAWRVRLAFFPVDSRSELPDFEVEIDYREDGIAEEVLQDYGDYTLKLMPETIEVLETDC